MIKIAVLVTFYNGEISPFEQSALECALEVTDAEVTVISMSPLSEKERLEYFTRLGAKAVLISDSAFSGSDTLATAKILARYFSSESFDLIMCGRQSLRGDTAQVPAELSEMLGYGFFPYVLDFNLKKVTTRMGEFELKTPCILSVERIKTLRFASVFSKKEEAKIIDNAVLQLKTTEIGLNGSPTKVLSTFQKKCEKKKCKIISFDNLDEAIKNSLNSEKKIKTTEEKKEKFEEVFYVGEEVRFIAESIGKKATRLKGDDLSLADEIVAKKAKIVLFPANLKYRALAPQIAARLNAGLCADCIGLEKSGEKLIMTRPALGGETVAKIVSCSDVQLATVRTKTDGEKIVFGIGYGALNSIEKIKKLAEKYGAEIVASRKAVDNSEIDYSMQVGLTGKILAPKVYVAFGISGAIQHIVGVENADYIIAVNPDKDAKIFDYADFGIIDKI